MHEKGDIPVEEISCIAKSEDQTVILLKTPREARYRGVEEKTPSFTDLKNIAGKLVVSVKGKIVGEAREVVIGVGEPGVRVEKKGSGTINWIKFIRDLRVENKTLAYKLESTINPFEKPRLPTEKLNDLKKLILEKGGSEREAQKLLNYIEREKSGFEDIPWSKILKIGDVILVGV